MTHLTRILSATASALLVAATAFAQPASLFCDHMVLQRDTAVPVWGRALPEQTVRVKFREQERTVRADDQGRWEVHIGPFDAGGPDNLVITMSEEIVIHDVLVGDVWVCSGQSNMEWSVAKSADPANEIANADHPNLRLFQVARASETRPAPRVQATWARCSPESVPDFSAVGYYFGRKLQHDLNVPIGLIQSAWGGTRAEAWTNPSALEADAQFHVIVERWDEAERKWQEALDNLGDGESPPPAPRIQNRPGGLYNGMIAPLIPFAIRGVIWYQGESNASRAHQYRELFPALIGSWRRAWKLGDFPFLFVQLANYKVRNPATWAELREAQTMALRVPNTGMAVTIDIGDPNDIHPKNKQEVGRRLALCALAQEYGQDITFSGPVFDRLEREDNALRIHFRHVANGLRVRGSTVLSGFEIASDDGPFVLANARVDGDTVVVSSDSVPNPVDVRYSFTDDPIGNLINSAWLPAAPFRTDDRKGTTEGVR